MTKVKKPHNRYVGFLDGQDGAWGVVIPDFPGCFGGGDTPEEAYADATSALSEFAAMLVRDGEEVPLPRSYEEVCEAYEAETGSRQPGALTYIPLIIESGKNVRANLSIDVGLLRAIDAEAKRRGLTRSAFLASAARDKIEQGR